jgi:glutamyl-tRNA synthetase
MVRLEMLVALVKERVSFVKDIWEQTDFFFKAPEEYDPEVINKRWQTDSSQMLEELIPVLQGVDDFTASATESAIKTWIESKGYNTGSIMNAFRLVIVGTLRGPHMFDIISWIGKGDTINRIEKGLSVIGKKQDESSSAR